MDDARALPQHHTAAGLLGEITTEMAAPEEDGLLWWNWRTIFGVRRRYTDVGQRLDGSAGVHVGDDRMAGMRFDEELETIGRDSRRPASSRL